MYYLYSLILQIHAKKVSKIKIKDKFDFNYNERPKTPLNEHNKIDILFMSSNNITIPNTLILF